MPEIRLVSCLQYEADTGAAPGASKSHKYEYLQGIARDGLYFRLNTKTYQFTKPCKSD